MAPTGAEGPTGPSGSVRSVRSAGTATGTATRPWRELEPGLEIARFATADTAPDPAGDLVVVRVDPQRWDLRLEGSCVDPAEPARSAREWCAARGLMVALNAGMYHPDQRRHVGFVQRDGCTVEAPANSYRSAAAFQPRRAACRRSASSIWTRRPSNT